MSTITDDGLDWYQERAIGDTGDPFDEVAVGTGSWEEEEDLETADELDEEEYRGDVDDNNIEIEMQSETGRAHVTIVLQGGTEVSGGTEITEMAVFSDGRLIWIDEFNPVEVESGHQEELTMPVEQRR